MTRDGPGTGTDTAVPDEGARTSARVGRRVRVLSALSGARRRSVMTAPGEAEVEGHRGGPPPARGTAATSWGGPRPGYWEARYAYRCASVHLPLAWGPGTAPRPSSIVSCAVQSPPRPGDVGSAEDLLGERPAGDQQPGEALAQLDHPLGALLAEQQPRVRAQHVGLRLHAGAEVLALGGEAAVIVEQAALDQRRRLRRPLLVAPAAGGLGRGE